MFLYYYEKKKLITITKINIAILLSVSSLIRLRYSYVYNYLLHMKVLFIEVQLARGIVSTGERQILIRGCVMNQQFRHITRARFSTQLILHNDTEIITVLNYYFLLLIRFAD